MTRIVITAIALLLGGWLAFDGAYAFATGNYVTPNSGPHAGQLGPWFKAVAALGFDPRSFLIKGVHVLLGAAWLIAAITFLVSPTAGWWGLCGCALGSLWYLPLGTMFSLIELTLLLLSHIRNLK